MALPVVTGDREAAADALTQSLINIHERTSKRTHTEALQCVPPAWTQHKLPHTLHIVTVCRGSSRVITSVRQEIPHCGWRLMNSKEAT